MKKLVFSKTGVRNLLSVLQPNDEIKLVGDEGVYLMSFAEKAPDEGFSATRKRTIIYAETCNPEIDRDYYENKRYLFGGDDGCETLGTVETFYRLLDGPKKNIEVHLGITTIKTLG